MHDIATVATIVWHGSLPLWHTHPPGKLLTNEKLSAALLAKRGMSFDPGNDDGDGTGTHSVSHKPGVPVKKKNTATHLPTAVDNGRNFSCANA